MPTHKDALVVDGALYARPPVVPAGPSRYLRGRRRRNFDRLRRQSPILVTDRFRDELQDALTPAYTIQRELTGGGMSHVFVAVEHALSRAVVVKVLKPELAAGVNRERFRREIMLAAQLQHPHIVPVLNAGEHGDLLWYTMPFVEGESLREALKRGRSFSARDVGRVLHDVLDALAYAHRRGVIHRDIKPGNILRHGAHSLVTDFGVAKALSAALPHSGTTSVGIAIGTPAYMAPEQLAADPGADHRMDLYAVGLLAYELLTGEQPFAGKSPQATMAAQLTRMPTPLEECCPGVPLPLAALVMRLLAKQPDDRPPTAEAALEELEAFTTPAGATASAAATRSSGQEAVATSDGGAVTVPASSARRRRTVLLAAIGLVVAALLTSFGIALMRRSGGRRAAAPNGSDAVARESVFHVRVPLPAALTRDDSLRIAEAVRKQLSTARQTDARRPGPDRNLDSLQRTLVRAYTDSAVREAGARRPERPTTAVAPPSPPSVPGATAGQAPQRGVTAPPEVLPPRASARARTSVTVTTPPPTAAMRRGPPDNRPRRVALLPVRDGTARPDLAPMARALEDSLRRALTTAGFTLATDAELVRLLSTQDLTAQRRIAEAAGIGALVTGVLSVREDEIVAQAIVLDVWRGYPMSEREETDLAEPQGALGLVRGVARALNRVSWRQRNDPKRIVLFDLENQTGIDSLAVPARALSQAVRTALATRLSIEVVADSQVRATVGTNERRQAATKVGAGAIAAGGLYRARADSVTIRLSARDMSEEKTFPTFELRVPRSALLDAAGLLVERLAADLAQVNWGPKGFPPRG
jgi:serine/threonine-protein kinase